MEGWSDPFRSAENWFRRVIVVRHVDATLTTGHTCGSREYLRTTTAALAQDRYKGTGPRFIKRGRRVLYRWSDILDWLDRNTIQRTDDPRQQR